MAYDSKEPWLNHLALTTVVFAVCATLSTFKGGGFSTRSVISQAQASDQWAFYQAKSTRESLYRLQTENLKLQQALLSPGDAVALEKYQHAIKEAEANIDKYQKQKEEIQQEAKRFEAARDEAQKHSQPFGLAVIFLQVAILISSIAGLFKRRQLWFMALPLGLLGVVYFANGFFLFF
ncbi:MAG TPA: DUF4337 domain-containing protein [Pseudomonadales bacterium]|nr:DUF4337 domain-containing protein [Pseudomonadales bacterium]